MRCARATARLRVAGLKFFFARVAAELPGFRSPFEGMDDRLLRKLRKSTSRPHKTALAPTEVDRLFDWLAGDQTPQGLASYSTMMLLLGTGLRAFEAVGLHWRSLYRNEETGSWNAKGVGKGDQAFDLELGVAGTYETIRLAYRAALGRAPRQDDPVLWTAPARQRAVPLTYRGLWRRVRQIGADFTAAGIMERQIVWSPHLTRHKFITALDKSGEVSPGELMQLARHKSLATTTKYIHTTASPRLALRKVWGAAQVA